MLQSYFNCSVPTDDLNKIKQLVQSREQINGQQIEEQNCSLTSSIETKSENGVHENNTDEENDETDSKAAPIPVQFLLNVSNFQGIPVLTSSFS